MALVAPNHFGHSSAFDQYERMAESRPSFTAVNGTASPAPAPPPTEPRAIDESQKEAPGDTHHQRSPSNPMARPAEHHAVASNRGMREEDVRPESRASPAPPLASAQTSTSVLAPIQPSNSTHPPERRPSPSMQLTTPSESSVVLPPINHMEGPGNNQQPPPGVMSPQKRKRSMSAERENPNSAAQPAQRPPQSPGAPRMSNGTENGPVRESYSPHHVYPPPQDIYHQPSTEAYPPPPPHHAYPPPPDHRNGHADIYPRPNPAARYDYDPPLDPSIAPTQERPPYSDSHLAEALQRENRNYDVMPSRENYVTPEEEDERNSQYGSFMTNRDSQSAEMDRKRRKRVFSNRTKTGCMTCRRRKKKCDEQHPECNNCLRGGFVCEGYTMRNTWQKPSNAKQPIPLQSKNGYPPEGPPGRAPYPPMSRFQEGPEYSSPAQPPSHSSRPSYESKRGSTSEHDGVYSRASPSSQKSQPAWSKSTGRPYPSNPPAASKYQGDEHRGSIYEVAPDTQESSNMQPPTQQLNRSGSAQPQYSQSSHPPNRGNTPPSHNAQAAAQAALTHPASIRPSTQSRRSEAYTEREKMLKGMYYYPMTPALTEDRERCIAAIWRFNNATNPSHGASPEERTRLFRQILSLRPSPEPPLSNGEAPPTNFPLPFGSCGERVVVEAPFHCDYGYNITIGDDVLIGADCRISDTCSVTIGARCIMSPNVKLVCATYPIDPRRRMGSNGPALGRNIVIEEDCWIGAGVTILAGVRVGKSSTVGAGSLLHQDVPRFTVVAGNPAKVSRGIYDGSGDGQ